MVYVDEVVNKLENAHEQQTQEKTSFSKDFVYKLLLISKAYKYVSQELKLQSAIDPDITWVREHCIEVRNKLAAKYKDGTEFGYTNGYDEGYKEGKKEGSTDGYDAGYEDGKADGYDDGYSDGEEKGYEKGYKDGDNDGYDTGRQDGYDEGKKDGYNDGFTEGQNSGYYLGSTESTAEMKNKFKSLSLCKRLVIAFTGNLK